MRYCAWWRCRPEPLASTAPLQRVRVSPRIHTSSYILRKLPMSDHKPENGTEQDVVESIVPMMPIVLPVVGGILMFLMIFIAVAMA